MNYSIYTNVAVCMNWVILQKEATTKLTQVEIHNNPNSHITILSNSLVTGTNVGNLEYIFPGVLSSE